MACGVVCARVVVGGRVVAACVCACLVCVCVWRGCGWVGGVGVGGGGICILGKGLLSTFEHVDAFNFAEYVFGHVMRNHPHITKRVLLPHVGITFPLESHTYHRVCALLCFLDTV